MPYMNEHTLAALQESILKWEMIRDGEEVDRGSSNCALCHLFVEDGCVDCPVAEKVKRTLCYGTPITIS